MVKGQGALARIDSYGLKQMLWPPLPGLRCLTLGKSLIVLTGVIVYPSLLALLELTHIVSDKCFGLNPGCAVHSLA